MATITMDRIQRPLDHISEYAESKYIVLLGRVLFSMIFIMSSIGHFSSANIQYAASQNVPMPQVLVPLSGILGLLGGLSILLGYYPRIGAIFLILFLVPITLMMHNFWAVSDPMMHQMQQAMFMKNLSMLGGALLVLYFGSGPMSIKR
jgi:putative oxidoreductase